MNIVITAGGTSEYIDTVRKITNSSSGKLGSLIVESLDREGNEIWYIHSPKAVLPQCMSCRIHDIVITSTMELKKEVENVLTCNQIDWFIHSMAVSDYIVQSVTTAEMLADNLKTHGISAANILDNTKVLNRLDKISSDEESLVLTLKKAPKIIGIVKQLSPGTKLVGFKLLSNASPQDLIKAAMGLLHRNGCEFVIANDLSQIDSHHHRAMFVGKDGVFAKAETKHGIANKLKEYILSYQQENS